MNRTRKKLDEAAFFLMRLEAITGTYPESDYYLSAFITSARSVTWVMRHEYAHVCGWTCWYESTKPSTTDAEFLSKMNEIRIRAEKKFPLETQFSIFADLGPEQHEAVSKFTHGKKVRMKVLEFKELPDDAKPEPFHSLQFGALEIKTTARAVRTISDFPHMDLLTVCRHYQRLLADLVQRCEQRFPDLVATTGTVAQSPPVVFQSTRGTRKKDKAD